MIHEMGGGNCLNTNKTVGLWRQTLYVMLTVSQESLPRRSATFISVTKFKRKRTWVIMQEGGQWPNILWVSLKVFNLLCFFLLWKCSSRVDNAQGVFKKWYSSRTFDIYFYPERKWELTMLSKLAPLTISTIKSIQHPELTICTKGFGSFWV